MSSKKSNQVVVRASVLEVRLLFNHILLSILMQEDLFRDFIVPDDCKKEYAKYRKLIVKDVVRLHDLFLPFDSELGTIDTGKGSLTPICKQNVKPGESIR